MHLSFPRSAGKLFFLLFLFFRFSEFGPPLRLFYFLCPLLGTFRSMRWSRNYTDIQYYGGFSAAIIFFPRDIKGNFNLVWSFPRPPLPPPWDRWISLYPHFFFPGEFSPISSRKKPSRGESLCIRTETVNEDLGRHREKEPREERAHPIPTVNCEIYSILKRHSNNITATVMTIDSYWLLD